jgi:hypothetical protein
MNYEGLKVFKTGDFVYGSYSQENIASKLSKELLLRMKS